MVTISNALESLLKKSFAYNASFKHTQLIIASWEKIMGHFAMYTGVLSLDHDELKIWVTAPQILYELKILQSFIITAIKREVPCVTIKNIVYTIKKYKKCEKNIPFAHLKKEKKTHSPETLNHIDYLINQRVSDEDLKEILKKVYVHCVI